MPRVHWLGSVPHRNFGETFGLPWSRGQHLPDNTAFVGVDENGKRAPLQSWVTAYWPDGSIKWTGHAIPKLDRVPANITVHATSPAPAVQDSSPSPKDVPATRVVQSVESIQIDTGRVKVVFPTSGSAVIESISHSRSNKVIAERGRLVLRSQSSLLSEDEAAGLLPGISVRYGNVEKVEIESHGLMRTVVRIEGKHHVADCKPTVSAEPTFLPFILRCYLYANSEAIRLLYTIIYDQDPTEQFIQGIGICFQVPLEDEKPYDRHVRFTGVDGGIFSEAVQGLTGLWKDPGKVVREAQVSGRPTPPLEEWDQTFTSKLHWVPQWNDFTLVQLSPDGYTMKKRTKPGHSWVNIPGGTRAGGFVYLGGARRGGLGIGLRHFWERYPTQIDIRNADSERGEITMWLYSPSAEPMDLRPYHDGLGQESFGDQLDALQVTYEDWEPGKGSPYGIARTNEIYLYAFEDTPTSYTLTSLVDSMRSPPFLIADQDYTHQTKAFGTYWSPQSKNSSIPIDQIEEILDFLFTFYKNQIAQRRWYGFWDHGDVMHTYDSDRHTWRYDIGGYAWDNSELSPDLWLWLYFLRTHREDVFRLAENLTRHTSEVDMYHLGPFKGLGTRHGIQHWSDSCKQVRVSNAIYRKYFYYLTGGDERTGEIMREALAGENTFRILDPYRKVRKDRSSYTHNPEQGVLISLGTDWSALASAWMIEWERREPEWECKRDKLFESIKGISQLKNGFVTGQALLNLSNGAISPPPSDPQNLGHVQVSHLSAMFGLVEICAELIDTLNGIIDGAILDLFRSAWLGYCICFNAAGETQLERYGRRFPRLILRQGHSRLTAYAARGLTRADLARRAWEEFYNSDGYVESILWKSDLVCGSEAPVAVDEASWVSTNITALYGLAAIQNLAFIDDYIGNRKV